MSMIKFMINGSPVRTDALCLSFEDCLLLSHKSIGTDRVWAISYQYPGMSEEFIGPGESFAIREETEIFVRDFLKDAEFEKVAAEIGHLEGARVYHLRTSMEHDRQIARTKASQKVQEIDEQLESLRVHRKQILGKKFSEGKN